jgi:hypothetical protein
MARLTLPFFLNIWLLQQNPFYMKKTISVLKSILILTLSFYSLDSLSQTNLAYLKPVTLIGGTSSGSPSNVVDGNTSTSWISTTVPSTLTVDLGATYPISNLILTISSLTTSFTVDISPDNSTWTTRATYANSQGGLTAFSFNFSSTTGRYVRFTLSAFRQPPVGVGGGLSEIEVYALTDVAANNLTVFNNANFLKGITAQGNVLIGKTSQTNATYKLDVAGKVRADELVVNATGADFVFDNNYKLRPLTEVEKFIKANNHLPEINSAEYMKNNGVNIAELQTQLLQKVEELTLYLIEQQKQIEKLKSENLKLYNLVK